MSPVRYDHLVRLSTPRGVFEHARGAAPRRAHGYCLDDVARVLVVVARADDPTPEVERLARIALDFTVAAADGQGAFHNRRADTGQWTDEPAVADHWGRAIWGLSQVVASRWCPPDMRQAASATLRTAMTRRSPWPRTMAWAAVGAAELLRVVPGDPVATALLHAAGDTLPRRPAPGSAAMGGWPEPALTYANALIPEAQLAIGSALGDDARIARGLDLLDWLVGLQTPSGYLSLVPHGGWVPGERLPGYDQQPIEAAALAEAAARAHSITGDDSWLDVVDAAAAWFLGDNDRAIALYDPATGAGCDALTAEGRNENRGAESTLAALATLQLSARFARSLA